MSIKDRIDPMKQCFNLLHLDLLPRLFFPVAVCRRPRLSVALTVVNNDLSKHVFAATGDT